MKNDEVGNRTGNETRLSRRRLLAGAVTTGMLVGTVGGVTASPARPALIAGGSPMERALRRHGGELGGVGRVPGGEHGDL